LTLPRKSLAARDRGPAGQHQDEIAAQSAVYLFDIIHVDQTGAADAQAWAASAAPVPPAAGCCARGKPSFPTPNHDVVAIRLDHFHLSGLDHVQVAAEFREQGAGRSSPAERTPRSSWASRAASNGLTLVHVRPCMARPHSVQCPAKAFLIEGLEQDNSTALTSNASIAWVS